MTSTTPWGSWSVVTLSLRSRRDRRKEVQKSVVSASPSAMPRILPTSLGRDPGSDDQSLTDHPVVDPDIHIGGVHEHVGEPSVLQWAGEELTHCLIDVLANP